MVGIIYTSLWDCTGVMSKISQEILQKGCLIFKMDLRGIQYGSLLFKGPYANFKCSTTLPVMGVRMINLGTFQIKKSSSFLLSIRSQMFF